MSEDPLDRDGMLSDGTPLRDVVAEMPVEVRTGGSLRWYPAVVVALTGEPGFELVAVEIEPFALSFDFPPSYVRKRIFPESDGTS
jgi:hypothetical protein